MVQLFRQLMIICIAIIAVLAPTEMGFAQGTFGSLPDPITSRDLDRYGEYLSLSDQQLVAIAADHRPYLEEFRELRDGDIERFLNDVRELAMDFDLSKRREVERLVRTFNRLMAQVRSMDERLFDSMLDVLTDEQAAKLPRVRQMRERTRYTSEMTRGVAFLNPAVRVDLSELVHELNLPPNVLERVDPVLEMYERRLTLAARDLFGSTTTMILETLKRLEEKGFTEGTPSDPRIALRLFEAFQEIWADISADVLDDAATIAALHRTTYRSLAGVMPTEDLRQLQAEYYRRAYPEAAIVGRAARRQFDAAMAHEDVPDDLKPSIASMADAHWQSQNRITRQIIELLEARRRDISIRELVRSSEDERQQQIDDLRAAATKADEAILESLHELLGESLAEKVRQARPEETHRRMVINMARSRGFSDGPEQILARLPRRISNHEIERYADQLGLDEGQRAVLESVHEDYLERYRQLGELHMAPLRRAVQELATFEADIRPTSTLSRDRIDEIFALHETAFQAIRDLDERFFDDMQLVVEAKHESMLREMRLERERTAYLGPAAPQNLSENSALNEGAAEAAIDISRLLDDAQLRDTLNTQSREVLRSYTQQSMSLVREKFNADMGMQRALQIMAASTDRRDFRRVLGAAGRDLQQANRTLAALNRETLNELRDLLDESDARQLEYQYRRRAFPNVYDDASAAEPRITVALELPDLGETQRSQLRDLAMEYRSEYARVANRMFEVHEANLAFGENRPGGQQRRELRNDLERLRFERDEINERAKRQLRAILNEDQLQRVGDDSSR